MMSSLREWFSFLPVIDPMHPEFYDPTAVETLFAASSRSVFRIGCPVEFMLIRTSFLWGMSIGES